ncbi:MAG: N-6 DNA methylase [Phycisphaerales bacterium]|nr:N-6 DNA methylase [Phycisphaerales bacterium]
MAQSRGLHARAAHALFEPPAEPAHLMDLRGTPAWSEASELLRAHRNVTPWQLNAVYESLLELRAVANIARATLDLQASPSHERRSTGSYYTPAALVEHVLDLVLEPALEQKLAETDVQDHEQVLLSLRICDPSCGAGHFLVAVARRLARRLARVRFEAGLSPKADKQSALCDVLTCCIFGVDINPLAIALCKLALWFDLGVLAPPWAAWSRHLRTGDALLESELVQSLLNETSDGFDVIVGNPPFLNQLQRATTRTHDAAAQLRAHTNGALGAYTDSAAAFLVRSIGWLCEGGRVAMVQPQSLLAARDARPVRKELLRTSTLSALWVSNEHVFDGASVYTCVPAFLRGGPRIAPLVRTETAAFTERCTVEIDNDALARKATWSSLIAQSLGVPVVTVNTERTLAAFAHATADFRDQYYGLDGFLVEDGDLDHDQRAGTCAFPRIVTTGLIDLADCRWGTRPTRILKSRWCAPRIDRARMDAQGSLGAWITDRMIPKVILATQTRTIEVFVDAQGVYVPSTPLITVTPRQPEMLWHVAAALASPVCSAHALCHYSGAALHVDAIKLSAKQVLTLPAPKPSATWDEAARELQAAHEARGERDRGRHLLQFAEVATASYELRAAEAHEVLAWWRERALTAP